MTSQQLTDFDANPPVPPNMYSATVGAVNVGYDLVFTLAHCFLRALHEPHLNLLVVGAGGGREIQRFLPDNPGWRLSGVDPSKDMLALAHDEVERLGLADRVDLVHGSVEALPETSVFDAATCLFVLHFLPDEAKLALLRATHQRLRPGAPLLLTAPARPDADDLRDEFLAAWQQHGELMGMPADRMAGIIEELLERQSEACGPEGYVSLVHKAGFERVVPFLSVMNGAVVSWIAR